MMHSESRFHSESRAFFDGERVVFQICKCAFFFEVDDDIWTTFDFQA